MSAWQRLLPDVGAALLVLFVGLAEVVTRGTLDGPGGRAALVLLVVAIAVAVGLARRAPAAALALVWCLGWAQLVDSIPVLFVEVAIGGVAFGVARWGSAATVWASALSIPLAAALAVSLLDTSVLYSALDSAGFRLLAEHTSGWADRWQLSAGLLGMAVLGVPWLAGLALRFSDRARRSQASQVAAEAERDQAEEIARLREDQAQLARDVHDVVGHSLAVILAQAESAQYLPDADTQALKRTMANIAESARGSLDDVRQVLASTAGSRAGARPAGRLPDLDRLVEGVRAGGHEVVATEVGTPQPMPPELELVAFRVLQEMLTNALKHGRRDRPVHVERHWEGDLRLEVQNAIGSGSEETQPLATAATGAPLAGSATPRGQGIDGMRRRLEAVGGRLDVRRREAPPTFTATAWVPVRPR